MPHRRLVTRHVRIRVPGLRRALLPASRSHYVMLVRMTVRNISWLAAIAAVVALSIGAAPAASAGTGPLLAELGNLGLSVYDNGGVLAAEGPAATVDKACTTLGTKDGYGAVAAYTGTDETGTGFVLFPGDHVRHGTEYGVDGVSEVNFQNC